MFVEVGVGFGRSVAYAVQKIVASGKRIQILAVDSWQVTDWLEPDLTERIRKHGSFFRAFLAEISSLPKEAFELIHTSNSLSVDAAAAYAPSSFPFIFLDADHSYESVRDDIAAWRPKVAPGGVIAGHDFRPAHPGVEQAVREAFGDDFEVRGSCWWKRVP
jgi:cephalosporin hydroxylase